MDVGCVECLETLVWSTQHTRWLADTCGSLRCAACEHLLLADTLPFELWQVVGAHCYWLGRCMGLMYLSQLDILSLLALCCFSSMSDWL